MVARTGETVTGADLYGDAMDTTNPQTAPAAPRRRTGRILASTALLLVLLAIVIGRWLSPNLVVGTIEGRSCDDASGYCVAHVTRGEWILLAPYDEWKVSTKSNPDRYYGAKNPFSEYADLTITMTGDVSISDGTLTLTWSQATLARLAD
jgi:hypothetical protein